MANRFGISVILIFLFSCNLSYTSPEHLELVNGWKFKAADDLRFASAKYNDSGWSAIQVGSNWQKQGLDYLGFAWYRLKIFIPSSLKQNSDSLKIFLGEIHDSHQLFINGEIIGENGKVVSRMSKADSTFCFSSSANGMKKYIISSDDPIIHWDKENLFAIRVFSLQTTRGMVAGNPFLGVVSLEDHIEFNKNFYKQDSVGNTDTTLVLINHFNKPIKGELDILCKTIEGGKIIYQKKIPVALEKGDSERIPVSLPVTLDQTKVILSFVEHQLKEKVIDSLIIPFVLLR